MNNPINKTVTILVMIIWLLLVHLCTTYLPYIVFAYSLIVPTVVYMIYHSITKPTHPEVEEDPKVITQLPVDWRLK